MQPDDVELMLRNATHIEFPGTQAAKIRIYYTVPSRAKPPAEKKWFVWIQGSRWLRIGRTNKVAQFDTFAEAYFAASRATTPQLKNASGLVPSVEGSPVSLDDFTIG